ncbi:hypothetical protein HDU81_005836 [Chytriomyces hyalinus]|nr:hypothetical protein HDU81_005836 [Chytriomyces hyalinus]
MLVSVATTTSASPAAPSPFPEYFLVNTTAGYAEKSEDFKARTDAGCIAKFHLDASNALQFDFNSKVCGASTDLRSQIGALFQLYKSDIVSADIMPDSSYVIQVYSSRIDDRRRDGFIKRRDAWTFTYNGVDPSPPTTTSSAAAAASSTTKAAAETSAEVPAASSTRAAAADATETAAAVQPSSVTANLYQAGASTASVFFGSVVAAVALLF